MAYQEIPQSTVWDPADAGVGQQSLDNLKAKFDAKTEQIYAEKMKAQQVGQTWSGDPQYAPWNQPHDCPHCGRCPSCGRGGYGYVPNYPPPYWPNYPQPYIGDIPYYPPTTIPNITWTGGTTGQAVCGNENRIY